MLTKVLTLCAALLIFGLSGVGEDRDARTSGSTRDWVASVLSYDGSLCSVSCAIRDHGMAARIRIQGATTLTTSAGWP